MLYMRSTIAAAVLITLSGCDTPTLDYRNAEISNGMIYESNENIPFTGLLTNLPGTELPQNRSLQDFIGRALKNMTPQEHRANAFNVLCDSNVKNGYLTGTIDCYTPNSRLKRFKAQYSEGHLDGDVSIYAADGSSYLYKGSFRKDEQHGTQEFYKLGTGALLERWSSLDGKADGVHEEWDATSGVLIHRSEAKNGTIIGVTKTWGSDGLLLSETPWVDGRINGTFRAWHKDTGNLIEESTFVNGVRQGPIKLWRSDGTLSHEGTMRPDGTLEPTSTTGQTVSHSPSPDCVDLWIDAFRAEAGDEAMINNEQLGEWEEWCENGQKP